ncbi:hypothetical protein DEO72_LG2g2938 [Vigna unguiculata]|uniref:Uncharacterized protein n=1 Tax=Vigna unguiculata TaxID=3917 RepID=A0A4D6L289_VIGUN|nr:hypothetical protein DEO72_LG2g2938 [Vigna unguiculata]
MVDANWCRFVVAGKLAVEIVGTVVARESMVVVTGHAGCTLQVQWWCCGAVFDVNEEVRCATTVLDVAVSGSICGGGCGNGAGAGAVRRRWRRRGAAEVMNARGNKNSRWLPWMVELLLQHGCSRGNGSLLL